MKPESQESLPAVSLPEAPSASVQLSGEQAHNQRPVGETPSAIAVERGLASPSSPPTADPAASAAVPLQPATLTDDTPASVGAQGFLGAAMPQIADDTDLIEKEWVDKAKEIVEQTAHDPYLQNQEINKVKVEYLKKRYNKDIKLSDA